MWQSRRVLSAIGVVTLSLVISAAVLILGRSDTADTAGTQLSPTTAPSSPSIQMRPTTTVPSAVATAERPNVTTTTPTPFLPTQPGSMSASGLLTIEPGLPRAHESHPARRDGYAEWVYAWPMPWQTEWSESYRLQPPLPRPLPTSDWTHRTYRFSPVVIGDLPFILINGEPVDRLTDDQALDIIRLVERHQLSLGRISEAFATADAAPLLDIFTSTYLADLKESIATLRAAGEGHEVAPYTHEIGAIAYYPVIGRAVVYEVYRNHTWLPHDLYEGDILRGVNPATTDAPGLVAFTLTWWQQDNTIWMATNLAWQLTYEPSHVQSFVHDYFDVLGPYHRLWVAAFAKEQSGATQ